MKKIYILTFIIFNFFNLNAQNFEGILTYESKTNIHVQKKQELDYKVKSQNKKDKDSVHIAINDSTLFENWRKKGEIVDSIKVIFGNKKFKKTYYKKDNIEYIFDFTAAKKITHTPKYECIDTTDIKLIEYKSKIKVVENDSIFSINGFDCKKLKVIKSNYYFIDIYYVESDFINLADAFIYDINNNLLFQNLYFIKNKLEFKKIIKLKYYTKQDAVDFEYILESVITKPYSESDFTLPEYEYCFWDTLDNKKLMRKHKKRLKNH